MIKDLAIARSMGSQFSFSLSAMGNCIRSVLRRLRRNRVTEKYALVMTWT